jgi:hypothetical protein
VTDGLRLRSARTSTWHARLFRPQKSRAGSSALRTRQPRFYRSTMSFARLARRPRRHVFVRNQLLLCAVLACSAPACESSSDSSPGASNGPDARAAGATGGAGLWITIDLPPAVEERVKGLIAQLGDIIRERSLKCCSVYGFRSLDDCTDPAGAPFLSRVGQVLLDGPENFDYSVDEGLAAACLDAARSVAADCTFSDEKVLYAWELPCMRALRMTKKGETPTECGDDIDCTSLDGVARRCFDHKCLAVAEVPTGDSCIAASNATSFPACTAADYCTSAGVCARRGQLGEVCLGDVDSCVEGYFCQYPSADAGSRDSTCAPKKAAGALCQTDNQCLDNLCICSADAGCAKEVCYHSPAFGDACASDEDCRTTALVCYKGRCQPPKLSICH